MSEQETNKTPLPLLNKTSLENMGGGIKSLTAASGGGGDGQTNQQNHPDIETHWNKLDKSKYYSIGVVASFGLRSIFFPLSLIGAHQVANLNAHESMSTIAKRIYSQQGIRGFYKGYFTAASGKCMVQFTYLSSLELINQYLVSKKNQHDEGVLGNLTTFQRQAVAGLLAEMMSNFIVVPFDVVSQRMMISNATHPNENVKLSSVIKEVWRMEGLRGFYRGMLTTFATYGPESAFCWGTFSALRENLSDRLAPQIKRDFDLMVATSIISGAFTGCMSAFLFHPWDIIRLRIQTGISSTKTEGLNGHKFGTSSVREVAVDLLKREGWRGFTKGISSKIAYNSGTCSLAMTVYSILKWTSRKQESD